jgi:uncharacterized protein YjiS (DUF1127 family)
MAYTHTLRGSAETAASPQASVLAGYLRVFREWRKRKAAIAELHGMDDRQLRDIGIGRSEIESVVYWAGRDPSRSRRD